MRTTRQQPSPTVVLRSSLTPPPQAANVSDDRARTTKQRSMTDDTMIEDCDDGMVEVDGGSNPTPTSNLSVLNHLRLALTVLTFLPTLLSSLLTSSTFTLLLSTFTPSSTDGFGICFTCSVLRLTALLLTTLSTMTSQPHDRRSMLGCFVRYLTTLSIELSLLFSQPTFTTVVGGTFKSGDAWKAAAERAGREAWLLTGGKGGGGLAVIAVGLWVLMSSKIPTKYLNRIIDPIRTRFSTYLSLLTPYCNALVPYVSMLNPTGLPTLLTTGEKQRPAEAAKLRASNAISTPFSPFYSLVSVCTSALYHNLRSSTIAYLTSGYVSPTVLTSLPTILYQSRHESSLFNWSLPNNPRARTLIVAGDLLMSNPSLSPSMGFAGTVGMGLGMYLAGVTPTAGFALNATTWCMSLLCNIMFPLSANPPIDVHCEYGSFAVSSKTTTSKIGKLGSSTLTLFARPFDDVAHYALVFSVFLIRPRIVSLVILLYLLRRSKPKKKDMYDKWYLLLITTLLLTHFFHGNGVVQENRIVSLALIAIVGGAWVKEVFQKEKGKVWRWGVGKVKEAWGGSKEQ